MKWCEYERLLTVLAEVGIIEPGYADASIRRRQTFVRKPGIVKHSCTPVEGPGRMSNEAWDDPETRKQRLAQGYDPPAPRPGDYY